MKKKVLTADHWKSTRKQEGGKKKKEKKMAVFMCMLMVLHVASAAVRLGMYGLPHYSCNKLYNLFFTINVLAASHE